MEKYRAKTVEELTKTLLNLAKGVHTPGLPAELREYLSMMRVHKLRHSNDAHAFCKCGGMQVLVSLLKLCEADSRDSVVVLGTIGNLCAISHDSRKIVRNVVLISAYITNSRLFILLFFFADNG